MAFYQVPKFGQLPLSPVSVIVACHNEAENLPRLLPALFAQHYPTFEVIVVNDRSTDATADILQSFASREPRLQVLHIQSEVAGFHPKKYALQKGIEFAQYPWLVFTDGDCLPASDRWLTDLQKTRKESTKIILGIGRYSSKNHVLSRWVDYETFYTAAQYLSFALSGMPYMGVGRNLSYRKDLFLEKNAFEKHRSVVGGDDDLTIAQIASPDNTSICLTATSHTVSAPPPTWKAWFRQKKRHLSVGKYYKLRDKALLGLLNLSHICFYFLFIPLLFVGIPKWILFFIFLTRMGLHIGLFYKIGQKISHKQPLYLLPLLDFMYPLYYLVIGVTSVSTKSIRWN